MKVIHTIEKKRAMEARIELRDRIAVSVLPSLVYFWRDKNNLEAKQVAKEAYEYADAMLLAREADHAD